MAQGSEFAGQVAIVVGGGAGIGREYCLGLAREGASVLVAGRGESAAQTAADIKAEGLIAEACIADVREGERIFEAAINAFGKVDILIVNAGILRDKTFLKMTDEEWNDVLDVHLHGTRNCAKAVWPHMMERGYGRILLTVTSGVAYGNYGQANYISAKSGTMGLTYTLAIEGVRNGIKVNAIAPVATSALTESVFTPELHAALPQAAVAPFALALVHPDTQENGSLIEVGGGWAAKFRWQRSGGRRFAEGERSVTNVLAHWDDIVRFDERADYPTKGLDTLSATAGEASKVGFIPVAKHGVVSKT
jgi:multifunctional beta-oxidation protein